MNTTTSTEELAARFESLKIAHDRDIKDKKLELAPFPLWALLVIYEKANYECYIDYMRGFKLLVHWLSPIAYPDLNSDKYDLELVVAYEVGEVAKHLNTSDAVIFGCIVEEVIPKLNTGE